MNNSKTPKIVVGVGLVAVYATILTVAAVRRPSEIAVTEGVPSSPSALSAQMTAEPVVPQLGTTESAAALASQDAMAPATEAAVATPASMAPPASAATKAAEVARSQVAPAPQPRIAEVPVESMPSPRPPAPGNAEELARSNSGTNAVSELGSTADTSPGETVTSVDEAAAEAASDSAETPALDTNP